VRSLTSKTNIVYVSVNCLVESMPPKKKLCITSQGQRRITDFSGGKKDSSEAEVLVDVNNNVPAQNAKIQNKFLTKWKSYYSWLRYDEDHDFMYCAACSDGGKRNGMVKMAQNRNFKRSTLERHSSLPDHRAAIQAPALQKDLEICQNKNTTKEDKAITVLLKSVKWLVTENVALAKFKSMIEFMHDVGVPDIETLKNTNYNYESQYTSNEFLDSLAAYVERELCAKLRASPVVTILADESTDIVNNKRLVIYSQIIDESMRPSTHYVCNVECTDGTGKGIAESIWSEMISRGITPDKVMSFGSDGAPVMTGHINGKIFSTTALIYLLPNKSLLIIKSNDFNIKIGSSLLKYLL